MLMVSTYLDRSSIEGLGLFAAVAIAKGALVWQWSDLTEVRVSDRVFNESPDSFQSFVRRYGYRSVEEGIWTYNSDFARHMNHAEEPSLESDAESRYFAARDLAPGDELTCDYRKFASEGCIDGCSTIERVVIWS